MALNTRRQLGFDLVWFVAGLLSAIAIYPIDQIHAMRNLEIADFVTISIFPLFFPVLGLYGTLLIPEANSKKLLIRGSLGVALGIETAFFVLNLAILYQWYKDPSNSWLEPLFLFIGLVIALSEFGRRNIAEKYL